MKVEDAAELLNWSLVSSQCPTTRSALNGSSSGSRETRPRYWLLTRGRSHPSLPARCEPRWSATELADDLRNLLTRIHSLRTALVAQGLAKGTHEYATVAHQAEDRLSGERFDAIDPRVGGVRWTPFPMPAHESAER
jgi:hypothetical protein